jgi:hypothetical protein
MQGLVNLVDVGPETTGTLMVKDKSHLAHSDFFDQHTVLTPAEKADIGDFYKFQPEELPYWDAFPSLGLSAKAGDLFLWDSRAAHQNIGPAATTDWRHVVYVCYQPRALAEEEDLKLKRQAWEEFLITTHWPSRNVAVFPGLGKNKTYYKSKSEGEGGDELEAGNGEGAGGVIIEPAAVSEGAEVAAAVQGAELAAGVEGAESAAANEASKLADALKGAALAEDTATAAAADAAADACRKGAESKSGSGDSSETPADEEGGSGVAEIDAAVRYWEGRVMDGSAEELLRTMRNRHNVEDRRLRKIAGVEVYEAGEVWQKDALLKLGE